MQWGFTLIMHWSSVNTEWDPHKHFSRVHWCAHKSVPIEMLSSLQQWLPLLWFWGSHATSLGLRLLIYKREMPTSQGVWWASNGRGTESMKQHAKSCMTTVSVFSGGKVPRWMLLGSTALLTHILHVCLLIFVPELQNMIFSLFLPSLFFTFPKNI